jgi:hypothetical protein
MREPIPLHLSPQDKLDALRNLDEFHFWHSLNDVRFCTECHRSITGWQIKVIESKGTRGRLHLQCPTEGCSSVPGQWVYDDPLRAATVPSDAGSFERQSTIQDKITNSHHGHARTIHLAQVGRNKNDSIQPADADGQGRKSSVRAFLAPLASFRFATSWHLFS